MAAPKNKGPKDPFDDIDDDKDEGESVKGKEEKEDKDSEKMSPEDILDSEEEVKEEKGEHQEEDKSEPIEEDEKADDQDSKEPEEEKEDEKPKHTFIAHKEEEDEFKDPDQKSSFDKHEHSEHTLDDLANEDKNGGGFSSYAKLGGSRHMDPDSSNINTHPPIPNSGIYSSKTNHGRGNKFHVLILIAIGILVIGATVYLLKSNFTFPSSIIQSTPTPTSTPESTPTPSPTPQAIDRSKFKIRVLNGTSTSGLAASEGAKLKNLGYQLERTGNATNSAFTKTQVRTKPGLDNLIQQLITDLAPDYSGASSSALQVSDTVDGEVVLGKH